MAYTVKLFDWELINLLEESLGNVYENIQEEDSITRVQIVGHTIEITIGNEGGLR